MPIHTRTCEDKAIYINHCTRGCAPEWTVDGTKVHACTNKTMRPEDIIKQGNSISSHFACRPCRDLLTELKFHKTLEKIQGTSQSKSKYSGLDLNTLVQKSGSPVEIVRKVLISKLTRFTPLICVEKRRKREGFSLHKDLDQRRDQQGEQDCEQECWLVRHKTEQSR